MAIIYVFLGVVLVFIGCLAIYLVAMASIFKSYRKFVKLNVLPYVQRLETLRARSDWYALVDGDVY